MQLWLDFILTKQNRERECGGAVRHVSVGAEKPFPQPDNDSGGRLQPVGMCGKACFAFLERLYGGVGKTVPPYGRAFPA